MGILVFIDVMRISFGFIEAAIKMVSSLILFMVEVADGAFYLINELTRWIVKIPSILNESLKSIGLTNSFIDNLISNG